MSFLTVALDVMGGDHGPSETVPAAAQALSLNANLKLLLVGDLHAIQPFLARFGLLDHPRIQLIHASQAISMAERPVVALRSFKNSSMRLAIDLVNQGQAAACVSAGNTGALVAIAKCVLKSVPGVERPALTTSLPTMLGGKSVLLDLGANVSCEPEILWQFAIMGSQVATWVNGIAAPRVALLNVGAEAIKGNEQVKRAATLLSATPGLNYIGFIEGDALFTGQADVIVCDGFVGNIALKTAEGMVRLISQASSRSLPGMGGWIQRGLTRYFKRRLSHLNPDQYNGASLLGLRGIVIKSHGRAERYALSNAILQAVAEVDRQLPTRIAERFHAVLTDRR